MKVLICGSRKYTNPNLVQQAIEGFQDDELGHGKITSIISGGARGIDTLARNYAKYHDIPFTEYPADWNKYGKSAGYKRNIVMIDVADGVIAIWDGESKGTKHSIKYSIKSDKPTYVLQP